ncbi:MAG: hypothetical protein WA982_11050, partial [Rubrobacteraceae bacterium]
VRGKNLKTGQTFQVVASSNPQTNPAISGETVVWESQRLSPSTTDPTQPPDPNYGRYDIEGAEVEAPPVTPTGLKAPDSSNGISLSWDANTDADLAGYNVYRSDSTRGTYVKLNSALLTAPSFVDQNAPKGTVSHYKVTAEDTLNAESLPVRATAAAITTSGLRLSASPATLRYGQATTLSGKLNAGGQALSGRQVVIERRVAGAKNFTAVARRNTANDGSFRLAGLKPKRNTSYRARFNGERAVKASVASRTVKVRAKVSMKPPNNTRPKKPVNVAGKVNLNNGKVNILIKRNGKLIRRQTVRFVNSTFRSTYKPNRRGKYTVQASVRKTRSNLPGSVSKVFSAR